MTRGWPALARNVLGLNRRNHAVIARYNPRGLFQVADHKLKTKAVLGEAGLPVVETLRVCRSPGEIPEFSRQARRWREFVIKPAQGAGGEGVVVVTGGVAGEFLTADGRRLSPRDLEAHLSDILGGVYSLNQRYDEAVAERRIRPHPVLARLSFLGVPDVRVVVFRGIPLMAMLRVATRASRGRANLHAGGIGVGIDLTTGETSGAVAGGAWVTAHPDTGEPLCGRRLPHWDECLLTATRCADVVALGYLGVDLTVDAERGPLVLELNARPGLLIQLANRRGLRPLIDAVERLPPGHRPAGERVRLGLDLYQGELGRLPAGTSGDQ